MKSINKIASITASRTLFASLVSSLSTVRAPTRTFVQLFAVQCSAEHSDLVRATSKTNKQAWASAS